MTDRPADPGFTPISPNPYIVGNPVRDRSMFFGREAEFDFVRSRIQDATAQAHGGLLLVFCGERRSGKTSILFQILDHRLGPAYIPVLIDMQSMAVGSELEFLTRVCEEVIAALGSQDGTVAIPQFTSDSRHAATFRKFVQDVLRSHPDKRLILLFDEYELFENKIDAGHLSNDVLLVLASLMEHERVFLIFTGSQHIDHRRRDYWETFLPKSHFKTISYLERPDATSLVCKPVEGRARYEAETVEAIYRLTAGQPFYTQAICQHLVDDLNEKRTRVVTLEAVHEVVDGIINNPLPQMIFLWDGLAHDEKLVLALLAECLEDETAFAGYDQIMRVHSQRGYRLGLDVARVAPSLERLFKSEMLLRSDRDQPVYAFRMDLWRLWIRRQHSVWQVVREEGVSRRRSAIDRVPVAWRFAIGIGLVSVLAMAMIAALRGKRDRPPAGSASGGVGLIQLVPIPGSAMVSMDEREMGPGTLSQSVPAGREHRFRLTAAGFADTEVVWNPAPGEVANMMVRLRARLGALRVETKPSGAEVSIDGVSRGRSPITIGGLQAITSHQVEAVLPGHEPVRRSLSLMPDTTIRAMLSLEPGRTDLRVSTNHDPSQIRIDGIDRGTSPLMIADVRFGQHRISASRDGYVDFDTTLDVGADTGVLQLSLVAEAPGYLIVKGDRLVDIYVGDRRPRTDTNSSGRLPLPPGSHRVQVMFKDDTKIDTSIVVHSNESVVYDFSRRTVTRQGGKP